MKGKERKKRKKAERQKEGMKRKEKKNPFRDLSAEGQGKKTYFS